MSWLRKLLGRDDPAAQVRAGQQKAAAQFYEDGVTRRFFEAIQNDDLRRVAAMLDQRPALVHAVGIDKPAIGEAAMEGHLEMVRLLITKGADVDHPSCSEDTPLHLAAVNNAVAVAELLLASGAQPNLRNDRGETPLRAVKEDIMFQLSGVDSSLMVALLERHGGVE